MAKEWPVDCGRSIMQMWRAYKLHKHKSAATKSDYKSLFFFFVIWFICNLQNIYSVALYSMCLFILACVAHCKISLVRWLISAGSCHNDTIGCWKSWDFFFLPLFSIAYTLRRKGSIQNLERFYQRYIFGTPKRFFTEPFLRVH